MDIIARFYAPYICLQCGCEGPTLLCEPCEQCLLRVPPRCYKCRQASQRYETCRSCRRSTPIEQVLVYGVYEGTLKEMLHSFKYERAQGAARQFGDMLSPLLTEYVEDVVLVYAPTATSRVRQRGYDHAELLARQLAKKTGLPYCAALARVGQAHQVGSDRATRRNQIKGTFRVRVATGICGKHVLLVDDIVTTGATLEEAARVLKKAGAHTVHAIVIAQP